MEQQPYIMAVDDVAYNLELLRICLSDINAEVACVESGITALEMIQERKPDLILLDIMMPEMDGYEVCETLKQNPETKHIPILFLSAMDAVDDKIKGFQVGGVDYVTKPFSTAEVVARVKTHLKLHRMLEEMNTLLRESFHEIYTPLGVIKGSLTLQELEHGESEHLQNIKAAVQSLHSIYEDIYYAIKKEVRDYPVEWIDLEAFLKKRTERFIPQMQTKSVTCRVSSRIDTPMMRINMTELERLIDNLLSNAVKYSLEKSEIQITLDEVDGKIELIIANASKKIKDAHKLFEALYREDHTVMGLGIGLSIVKKICEKYRIDINVASKDAMIEFILRYKERG
ncbi:MAG TPA: hybrid sensor histidine kinase/response regulator [Epsilonproteobacteria bacterium]|nr:hybrid sensor histidine kinase/response regulator [Campylobacterota bacterium]